MKMAKYANAGELRTPVKFIRIDRGKTQTVILLEVEVDVIKTKCKWVNVPRYGSFHGHATATEGTCNNYYEVFAVD